MVKKAGRTGSGPAFRPEKQPEVKKKKKGLFGWMSKIGKKSKGKSTEKIKHKPQEKLQTAKSKKSLRGRVSNKTPEQTEGSGRKSHGLFGLVSKSTEDSSAEYVGESTYDRMRGKGAISAQHQGNAALLKDSAFAELMEKIGPHDLRAAVFNNELPSDLQGHIVDKGGDVKIKDGIEKLFEAVVQKAVKEYSDDIVKELTAINDLNELQLDTFIQLLPKEIAKRRKEHATKVDQRFEKGIEKAKKNTSK